MFEAIRPSPRVLGALAMFGCASVFGAVSSCGSYDDPSQLQGYRGSDVVSPRLLPYVQEFVTLFGRDMPMIPVSIGFLTRTKAGVCVIPPSDGTMADSMVDSVLGESSARERRVVINAHFFDEHKHDPDGIRQVVFHELGHCLLDRGHVGETFQTYEGQVPKSIMHTVAFATMPEAKNLGRTPFFRRFFDYYVAELFGRPWNPVTAPQAVATSPYLVVKPPSASEARPQVATDEECVVSALPPGTVLDVE